MYPSSPSMPRATQQKTPDKLSTNDKTQQIKHMRVVYIAKNKANEEIFSGSSPCFPGGWRIVQSLRQRRRKTTNTASTPFSAIQAASQSIHFYK